LGERGKYFLNKEDHIIEFILINMKTPYDAFYLTLCVSWASKNEDDKDYTFYSYCGFLIRAWEKFLNEGEIEIKKKDHVLKGKFYCNFRMLMIQSRERSRLCQPY